MEPENAGQDHAKVKVVKVDSIANVGLSGATFGIYRDGACTDLITNMAETDENGESEQEVAVTQDRVYSVRRGGIIFGLYAAEDIQNEFGNRIVEKDTLMEKATTDADGIAAFIEDIPADFGYYVKEEQETEGYQKNMDVYSFRFDYNNDKDAEVEFSYAFTGAKITASIQLARIDLETNQPQGDAALKNAVYGFYISHELTGKE